MDPDITVVLNISKGEARYFSRTLRSLEEATSYAHSFGINTELVVVMDNADERTTEFALSWKYVGFTSVRHLPVSNGSLGLSRNSGVDVAQGRYVATCDSDDLVSFNSLAASYFSALAAGPMACVFPEYLFVFGRDASYIHRYFGGDAIPTPVMLDHHPFTSRIFAPTAALREVKYKHTAISEGYAYEDWLMNCDLLAHGYTLHIASGAVLYYRQRPGSLLRLSNEGSLRLIPSSALFEPSTYLPLAQRFMKPSSRQTPREAKRDQLATFISNPLMLDMTAAANRIDPEISALELRAGTTNVEMRSPIGDAYYRVCSQLVGRVFTDIVLLPFLSVGGGEKFILNILDGIQELEPSSRFLFLLGEPAPPAQWLDRLPPGSEVIDLWRTIGQADERGLQILTLRTIHTFGPAARIHVKESTYTGDFYLRFWKILKKNSIVYYRFTEDSIACLDRRWTGGGASSLLSETLEAMALIVTDHDAIIAADRDRFGVCGDKWTRVYTFTQCEPAAQPGSEVKRRLVWASRLSRQKRPDLLARIARELLRRGVEVHIDAFGREDELTADVFVNVPNLTYRGGFSRTAELSLHNYDALLYTADFDGLPNIVLEAMGEGIPAIAPDIGGIGEAVMDGETGVLIARQPDDDTLVYAYADAVERFYNPAFPRAALAVGARNLIQTRHGWETFLEAIAEAFGLRSAAANDVPPPVARIARARLPPRAAP